VPTEEYLPIVLREFRQMKRLADRAFAQVRADGFFAVAGVEDNSLAVIVKHVGGNLRSRWTDFLAADGEKPDRQRDGEFIIGPADTREHLLARWEEGWGILFRTLESLRSPDLEKTVTIRGEGMTALVAINRGLTHNAYHIGQIVFLAKHLVGAKWESLSIPRGRSEQFNAAPKKYVQDK
jgi:hypothetical protein